MHFLPDALRTVLSFAVVLGVLVFIHELGHYLAARWRGVHVEAFSIGLGPKLVGWTDRAGTVWKVSALPLGGYVRLHGQGRPEDVEADERARYLRGRTFYEKSVGSRAIVVAAGPVANFLLAFVLFALLFATVGRQVLLPDVSRLVAGGAAERGGLQVGDRILAIGGTPTPRFEDLQRLVAAAPDTPLTLRVLRDGAERTLTLTTGAAGSPGHRTGVLGILSGKAEFEPVGPVQAIGDGAAQTWNVAAQTLGGVWQMITGRRGTEDLGGPLRIAQMSGEVAQLGLASLVSFIAVLSVNLGMINLFPIPVLDGGYLLFYLAEALRGRPVPARALDYGLRAGLALLASLFVFATWNDLSHLGVVRWVASLLG